jgi:hypothetical protein
LHAGLIACVVAMKNHGHGISFDGFQRDLALLLSFGSDIDQKLTMPFSMKRPNLGINNGRSDAEAELPRDRLAEVVKTVPSRACKSRRGIRQAGRGSHAW